MKLISSIHALTLGFAFYSLLLTNAVACPKDQAWTIGVIAGNDAKLLEPGTSINIGKSGSKCSFSQIEKGYSDILKSIEKINVNCNFEAGTSIKGAAVYSVEKTGKENSFPFMLEIMSGDASPATSITISCVPK